MPGYRLFQAKLDEAVGGGIDAQIIRGAGTGSTVIRFQPSIIRDDHWRVTIVIFGPALIAGIKIPDIQRIKLFARTGGSTGDLLCQ